MVNTFLSFFGISISVSFVVAALVLSAKFLNKRYAAKWKYRIWVFLALWLLIPFRTADGRIITDKLLQIKTGAAPKEETHTENGGEAPLRRIVVEIPEQMAAPIAVQSAENNAKITMLDLVAWVWMAGGLIFISMHVISYFKWKCQVERQGRPAEEPSVLGGISGLKRELHIRRTIRAVVFSGVQSPMVIGFLKPVLVLPEETYSQEELYFILKHEIVHLKRGDVYFKLLFVAANAVHWYNPFIWIMQKEAEIDIELSCDEMVTKGAAYDVRIAYTEALLSVMHKQCAKRAALSTQFYGGKKIMKKRFENILTKYKKKNGIAVLLCTIILTVSIGALAGCTIEKVDAGRKEPGDTFAQSKQASTKKTLNKEALNKEALNKEASDKKASDKKATDKKTTSKKASDKKAAAAAVDSEKKEPDDAGGYLSARDCKEIKKLADKFAAAYFEGSKDTILNFLASTYAGEAEIYTGTGAVSGRKIKGLSDTDEKKVTDGGYVVSVEFRDSNYADMYLYLTIACIRQDSGWKIQWYGIEG